MNAREKLLYQADSGHEAYLSVTQTNELRDWVVDQMAIELLIINRYGSLFPNYVWTDARTAIDLMAAEIKTLRKEHADERSRRASLHQILTQVCETLQCDPPDENGLGCAPLLAAISEQGEVKEFESYYPRIA